MKKLIRTKKKKCMSKRFLETITLAAWVINCNYGAFAMMSDQELKDCVKITGRHCTTYHMWQGHKPKVVQTGSFGKVHKIVCAQCDEAKAKLSKHKSALANKSATEDEETRLRMELMQAQIDAPKGKK